MALTCQVCDRALRMVTNTHLARHGLTVQEYCELFPGVALSSESRNEAISLSLLGNKNSEGSPRSHDAAWRAACSGRMQGNKHGIGNMSKLGCINSPEHRAAVSVALHRDYASGARDPIGWGGVVGYYKPLKPSNREVQHYRSSVELAYMQHLDMDPEVLCWEYESLRIPYSQGRIAFPDFLVFYEHRTCIVEIKGGGGRQLDAYYLSDASEAVKEYAESHEYEFSVLEKGDF